MQFRLPARWRDDRVLLVLCALALLIALAFNFAIMPGFGPDETRHFAYVKLLWDEHTLPRILSNNPYSEYKGAHAFHPPLYYLALLPFYAVGRLFGEAGAYHFLRFWSGLLCVAALPMLYDIGMEGAKKQKEVARLAVGTVALVPMFALTAGTLNNDAGAFFMASLFLWLLLVRLRGRTDLRAALILGLVLGLGALTKATVLAVGAVALLLCAWIRFRGGISGPLLAKWAAVCLFVGLVVVSPWHIRSMQLYGTWTPLPESAPWIQLPKPSEGKLVMAMHPNFPGVFAVSNWALFYTLWGQRDWLGQQKAPFSGSPPALQSVQLTVYALLALLSLAAIAGTVAGRKRKEGATQTEEARTDSKAAFFAPLAAFGVIWLTVLQVALFWHQGWAEGGRYLFPAFFGFAFWLSRSWKSLLGARFGLFSLVWLVGLGGLTVLSWVWLLVYLNPTYGPK